MAADDADRRAVLTEHGVAVPARGKLSADHHQIYDQIVSGTWEYPGDPEMGEQTPRSTAGQSGRGRSRKRSASRTGAAAGDLGRSLWGKARAAGKADAKRRPWVGTADIIEHFWSQLAWSARPLPPLQKILAAQAPMAGVILQDAARGTFVDKVLLQPAARAENRLQAANAMIGPPAWVLMISLWGGAQADPRTGEPVIDPETGMWAWDDRTQVLVGGLRFSLMSWLKIADAKAEEIQQNSEEMIALGAEADKLIAWILAPSPGMAPKDVEREAAARGADFARAGAAVKAAAGPVTLDDTEAALSAMAGSALRPAPATGSRG